MKTRDAVVILRIKKTSLCDEDLENKRLWQTVFENIGEDGTVSKAEAFVYPSAKKKVGRG